MPHHNRARTETDSGGQLARGLGWFSSGLGLAEVTAPGTMARLIGIPEEDEASASMLRALGAREIAHGVSILMRPDSAPRLWPRVGGDAIDLAFLASAMNRSDTERGRLAAAAVSVMGVTALDVLCAQQLDRGEARGVVSRRRRTANEVRVEQVVTVNRPVEVVYQFWRNYENFPRFMRHLTSVETLPDGRTRWRAKAPAGMSVEWIAETVQDVENEWIAWRSLDGSDVRNSGSVRFRPAPGARGTEVRVQMQYSPPGGTVGRTIAWLFGEEPDVQIKDDLRRFKQLVETGEIPLSDGPGLWRATQPPARPEQIKKLAGVRS